MSFPNYIAMLAAVLALLVTLDGYAWFKSYPLTESQLYLNGATNAMHILNNEDSNLNISSPESWELVRVVNNLDMVCFISFRH